MVPLAHLSQPQTAYGLVQPFLQRDQQTDRQTDHATSSVAVGHYCYLLSMRCGRKKRNSNCRDNWKKFLLY